MNKGHPRERQHNYGLYRHVVFILRLFCFILSRKGYWSVTFMYRVHFSLSLMNSLNKTESAIFISYFGLVALKWSFTRIFIWYVGSLHGPHPFSFVWCWWCQSNWNKSIYSFPLSLAMLNWLFWDINLCL